MVTYNNNASLSEGNLGYPGSSSSNQESDQEPSVSLHPSTLSTSSSGLNQRYNMNQNWMMYNNSPHHQNGQIMNSAAYVHHNPYVNPSQSLDNFMHPHTLAQQSSAMFHHPNSVYQTEHNNFYMPNLVPSSVQQHSQQNNHNAPLFGHHAAISAASPSISGRTTGSDVSNSPGILSESVSPIDMQQVSPTTQQSLLMEDERIRNHHQRSMPSYPQQQHPQFDWMKKNNAQAHPNPGKTRTKDKYRVVYTDTQRTHLEREFMFNNKYINIKRKCELAEVLGLSERQVKIWFQNRRAKDRKQSKREADEKKRGHLYNNNINNSILVQPLSLPNKFDNEGML